MRSDDEDDDRPFPVEKQRLIRKDTPHYKKHFKITKLPKPEAVVALLQGLNSDGVPKEEEEEPGGCSDGAEPEETEEAWDEDDVKNGATSTQPSVKVGPREGVEPARLALMLSLGWWVPGTLDVCAVSGQVCGSDEDAGGLQLSRRVVMQAEELEWVVPVLRLARLLVSQLPPGCVMPVAARCCVLCCRGCFCSSLRQIWLCPSVGIFCSRESSPQDRSWLLG